MTLQRSLRGLRPSPRGTEGERVSRVALVKLPDLPLQMLLHERPEFRGRPTAVITGDGPGARITYLNRAALAAGLRVGLTHAAARDRLPGLHTGMLTEHIKQQQDAAIAQAAHDPSALERYRALQLRRVALEKLATPAF